MSVIYGIVHRRGGALSPEPIRRMGDALKQLPHVRQRSVQRDNVAFGHLLALDTPESINDGMPIDWEDHRLLFTARGRLDNREELTAALSLPQASALPDSELMLLSYLRWGTSSPERLIGDWSYFAFHTDRQELFLARDHHGSTAVDYHIGPDFVVFSSNLKALLALPEIPKRLNVESLYRSMLIWQGSDFSASYYKDIPRLPGGHTLTIGPTTHSLDRYWIPEAIEVRHEPDVRVHAEVLRSLLDDAIAARMRHLRPAGSMLSGGLDSGTVSYLAAERLRASGTRLPTFSHVPLCAPTTAIAGRRLGDETPQIRAIVAASGNMEPSYLDSENISVVEGMMQWLDICESPTHAAANAFWLIDIAATAAGRGIGTLLSGDAGNATLSFNGLAHQLPWRRFLSHYGIMSTLKQKGMRPIYMKAVAPIRLRMSPPERRIPKMVYLKQSPMLTPWLRRLRAESRSGVGIPGSLWDSRSHALAIVNVGFNPRNHAYAMLSDHFGLQWTDPTADKRVLEYTLTIPNEAFFDEQGGSKNLVRTMMKEQLPDSVLVGRLKGMQSADIGLRLWRRPGEIDEIFERLQRSALTCELLDLQALRDRWIAIERVEHNDYDPDDFNRVLKALMFGVFLTRFDDITA